MKRPSWFDESEPSLVAIFMVCITLVATIMVVTDALIRYQRLALGGCLP